MLIFGISQGFTFAYNPEGGRSATGSTRPSIQLNGSTLDPATDGATRASPQPGAQVSAEW